MLPGNWVRSFVILLVNSVQIDGLVIFLLFFDISNDFNGCNFLCGQLNCTRLKKVLISTLDRFVNEFDKNVESLRFSLVNLKQSDFPIYRWHPHVRIPQEWYAKVFAPWLASNIVLNCYYNASKNKYIRFIAITSQKEVRCLQIHYNDPNKYTLTSFLVISNNNILELPVFWFKDTTFNIVIIRCQSTSE